MRTIEDERQRFSLLNRRLAKLTQGRIPTKSARESLFRMAERLRVRLSEMAVPVDAFDTRRFEIMLHRRGIVWRYLLGMLDQLRARCKSQCATPEEEALLVEIDNDLPF